MLHVTGVNGRDGRILGIVDSGADTSSFPFGYASLMGYTPQTLVPETFGQAGGTGTAFRAQQPCTAYVPEIPQVVVSMTPSFIPGAQMVLWGRKDFMTYFDVAFQETQQRFTITPV